ncbi:uncharacterized protein LOC129587368 [Paramacrobiotus metropolitanus]|uniref:uncharacterized protein LOC129587368 n=1 Tax=Paramacrobiotus metropolitanus TaxID=2943436 RepID=UPI002446521F|nr:uncharacterized protein LOC129587368 [Paramacrobiotus metropolitanus]XP_055337058.1 uncharacterized protein LOC129587368 [Paramacrobiotus metropolitanus]
MPFVRALTSVVMVLLLGVLIMPWMSDGQPSAGDYRVRKERPVINTTRHSVILTSTAHLAEKAILKLLFARWKSVLAEQFVRKAIDIQFVTTEETADKQRIFHYAVAFTTNATRAPHVEKGAVVQAMNDALQQHPIPGVSVHVNAPVAGLSTTPSGRRSIVPTSRSR